MELRFEHDQPHQLRALRAVIDLFEGQGRTRSELRYEPGIGFLGTPNRLDLDETAIQVNAKKIQEREGIPLTEHLGPLRGGDGTEFNNFSIEMETGTGKTYVYLRTAIELHRRYGFCKFIVVVPSVAIREGVLKTLAMTRQHFAHLYDNVAYRYAEYDSSSLAVVRQFALSDGLEFLVMTLDSFNKADNVMFRSDDRLQGDSPVSLIRSTRPILILDEPQNMESEKSVAALAGLHPLFALRYSATHRNPYCLLYRLTPFDAYEQRLVKRIEVAGIVSEDDANRPFMRLQEIRAEKDTIVARMALQVQLKTLAIKEKIVTVKPHDNLAKLTGRPEYQAFTVAVISAAGGFVRFTNGFQLGAGEVAGGDRETLHREQIRYTIQAHIEKQNRLRALGIKVLSLFFIDRVDNYSGGGPIRRIFDEEFQKLRAGLPEWASVDPGKVQSAYFATRRTRDGREELLESKTGRSKEDQAAFQLIMRDKERLLSMGEPVAFIFSHSALREGWDNPNVFQICTLAQSRSEVRKRQEIGRGVRLAVDQEGRRVLDPQVNRLTVVANDSYEAYVKGLQSEIEQDFGGSQAPPAPDNARDRKRAKLRREILESPLFQQLWAHIARKTAYAVKLDPDYVVADIAWELERTEVPRPRIAVRLGEVVVAEGERFAGAYAGGESRANEYAGPAVNVTELILTMLAASTPPMRLTRATIVNIVERCKNPAFAYNPQAFATAAARAIRAKLAQHIVEGIDYTPTGETYEPAFADEVEGYADRMVSSPRGLYDQVLVDSAVERRFVDELESRNDIVLYCKLPPWFSIPTPAGAYNPDWAIVQERRNAHGALEGHAFIVRETKGTADTAQLQWTHERQKVLCGKRHFIEALKVDYRFGPATPALLDLTR